MQFHKTLIRNYLDLMTSQPKTELSAHLFKGIMILQFCYRLHYLLPSSGWDVWQYSDFKWKAPQMIFQFVFIRGTFLLKLLVIIWNCIILVLGFMQVKFIYYYNNVQQAFLIPQMGLLLQFNEDIVLSCIGLIILGIHVMLCNYLNRSTKFLHNNPFVRKFTQLAILITLLDGLCLVEWSYPLITLVWVHFQGVLQCLDVLLFKPYRSPYNRFVFQVSALQYSCAVITTININVDDEYSMFYQFMLFGLLMIWLADKCHEHLMERTGRDQYLVLNKCQQLYLSTGIIKIFKICQHINECRIHHNVKDITQIIQCILEQGIKWNRQHKNEYEILELALIHFRAENKSSLQAYCRLKQYMNCPNDHTMYFKITCKQTDRLLWKKVTDLQKHIKQQIRMKIQFNWSDIRTRDVYEANILRDKFLPLTVQVLHSKMEYWINVIKNIHTVQDLFSITLEFSGQIRKYEQSVMTVFGCDIYKQQEYKTIIQIKLLEIYYSVIMNDAITAYKYQRRLYEMMRVENPHELGKILNSSVIENKVMILFASMVLNRGSIVRFNMNSVAKFWNYENEMDFREINHVNQLMPEFVAAIHDHFLERFIDIGHSELLGQSRGVFLKDKNNFLIPSDIRIDNFFVRQDDYVMTAAFVKTKESSLFILFDRFGMILGVNQLMFKLLYSVDPFIQLSDVYNGYIYHLVPQIFDMINTKDFVNSEFSSNEDRAVLRILNSTRNTQSKTYLQASPSFNEHWVNWGTKRGQLQQQIELFDRAYQERMKKMIDYSQKTTNFEILCGLDFRVLGCSKQMPIFILEITDLMKTDLIGNNTTSIHSLSGQLSEFSSIQEEYLQQVQSDYGTKQMINGILMDQNNYEQQEQSGIYDSSRLAPMSQRASFVLIKHKSLEDDSKIIEEDLRKLQQEIIEEHDEEDSESSVIKSKRGNIIHGIQEKRFKDNNVLDAVNSVGSMNTTFTNYSVELIRQIYKSTNLTNHAKLMLVLLALTICMFIGLMVAIVENDQSNISINQINQINAPYLFNQYFCQMYTHILIYAMSKVGIMQCTDALLNDIEQSFHTQNILQDMNDLYPAFLQIEAKDIFPKQTIWLIQDDNIQNVSFTMMFNVYQDRYRYFIDLGSNYEQMEINETSMITSLFLLSNLQDQTNLNRELIYLLIQEFNDEVEQTNSILLSITLIWCATFTILFLSILLLIQKITQYYSKIIQLNCRVYEKDIHTILHRLHLVREILTENSSLNWKKADYVQIMFGNVNQSDVKSQSKIIKPTLLSSRIQSQHILPIKQILLLLILLVLSLLYVVGGYINEYQLTTLLKPTQDLTAQFIEYSTQIDTLVAQSFRVKSQQLLLLKGGLMGLIRVQKQRVYNVFTAPNSTDLTYFNQLYDEFNTNQIQLMINIIKNDNIDPIIKDELYALLFDDLCDIMCTTSEDSKDYNRLYANKGLIGIITSLGRFIQQNYNYERENNIQDPDLATSMQIMNSDEFMYMLSRHFTNTKYVFDRFNTIILKHSTILINHSYEQRILYYVVGGWSILLVELCGFIWLVYSVYNQIILMRLSVVSIPLDLLDSQAISILRTL